MGTTTTLLRAAFVGALAGCAAPLPSLEDGVAVLHVVDATETVWTRPGLSLFEVREAVARALGPFPDVRWGPPEAWAPRWATHAYRTGWIRDAVGRGAARESCVVHVGGGADGRFRISLLGRLHVTDGGLWVTGCDLGPRARRAADALRTALAAQPELEGG